LNNNDGRATPVPYYGHLAKYASVKKRHQAVCYSKVDNGDVCLAFEAPVFFPVGKSDDDPPL